MDSHIQAALREDLLDAGDITSKAIFSGETDTFILISKDTGILCGSGTASEVLRQVDPAIQAEFLKADGDSLEPGMKIAVITGPVASVLTAERTMLNYLSHLSGIATKTRTYVEAAGSSVILDTRKTIPGLRRLEKYAVACGGGQNHRMGLFDMVMIKDNHIDAAGGIQQAVARVRDTWGNRYKIEVEARSMEEVRQALESRADRIMLDNMDNETMGKAVAEIGDQAETEASGNVTLSRIGSIAATGVDYISIGGLTHTVTAFDFSLKQAGKGLTKQS